MSLCEIKLEYMCEICGKLHMKCAWECIRLLHEGRQIVCYTNNVLVLSIRTEVKTSSNTQVSFDFAWGDMTLEVS